MHAFFALQRGVEGLVPVTFAERPDLTRGWARSVVPETVVEVPPELHDATFGEVLRWRRAVALLELAESDHAGA
jgi:hypothetical protein